MTPPAPIEIMTPKSGSRNADSSSSTPPGSIFCTYRPSSATDFARARSPIRVHAPRTSSSDARDRATRPAAARCVTWGEIAFMTTGIPTAWAISTASFSVFARRPLATGSPARARRLWHRSSVMTSFGETAGRAAAQSNFADARGFAYRRQVLRVGREPANRPYAARVLRIDVHRGGPERFARRVKRERPGGQDRLRTPVAKRCDRFRELRVSPRHRP